MRTYRADLHIHTVLSPCGDLDMSPVKIVDRAVKLGLDMIAITDHNHTGHCKVTRELGIEKGLKVVYGAEVNTREEVHCLTYFDTDEQLTTFQRYLDDRLPRISNDNFLFGEQIRVDSNEVIIENIEHSLYPAIEEGISEVSAFVHSLGGLFVPAHVDRRSNGLYTQLGMFPDDCQIDAVEIFRMTSRRDIQAKHPELKRYQLLKSSDAHYIKDLGRCWSSLEMESCTFDEMRMALHGVEGRRVIVDD